MTRPRSTGARGLLEELFQCGLRAVHAGQAVARAIQREGERLRVRELTDEELEPRRCHVLAAGKAATQMAGAWHERAGAPRAGLAIAREAGDLPTPWRMLVGGHPLPTPASARAGQAAHAFAAGVPERDPLVALLSGGASALLSAPLPGIPLADLRATTQLLLRSGAEIGELNCVRKHLTRASGGRLAAATRAERVIVLVLSDVIGDDLATIASGPFAPDPTRFADAARVLESRGVWDETPRSVRDHLARGAAGEIDESPKPGAAAFGRVAHRVIASNELALVAVEQRAQELGMAAARFERPLRGEARALGIELAQRGLALRGGEARLLVAGGEPTVTVRGRGRGGRCQELALAAACALAGEPGVSLLAASTDGSDGPTDAAGAFVDGETLARGEAIGRSAREALADNDAHGFLARAGGLLRTGPTGTNALDVVLVLAEANARRPEAPRLGP